ncbi:TldD/PmbA family protein [Acidothermaceae bacterium B102]|nr:TldD/PmbA family protein [Acidothermaceae bacterium B102]
MTAYGEDRLLALGEAVVSLDGASEVEVLLHRSDIALTRFAESRIHQNVARSDGSARIRVVVDGTRVGVVATNVLTPDSVREAAEQAREIAGLTPPDPRWPGLAEPAPYATVSPVDAATASADPAWRADLVARLLAELPRNVYGAGTAETDHLEVAVVNSRGVRAYAASTRAAASILASGADSTGWAQSAAPSIDRLDPATLGRRAADKVVLGIHPREVDPGHWAVVLEPGATQALAQWLGWSAFPGKALQEGRSPLTGRMGNLVCSPLVTIVDDATSPLLPGVPFDAEGTPTHRHLLIDHGVAVGVTHDRASAALAGTSSTGHALPAPNHEGGFATHLVIEPGTDDQDRLVAGMEHGLLVTRFHYTNLAHAMTSTITGMTRDGTFLVEDGRIIASVRNLRFTQSIIEALSHVEAVGSSCEVSSDTFEGSAASPAMRIARFHFTSTSGH